MQSAEARYRIEEIPRSLVAPLRRDGGFIIGIKYYPGIRLATSRSDLRILLSLSREGLDQRISSEILEQRTVITKSNQTLANPRVHFLRMVLGNL